MQQQRKVYRKWVPKKIQNTTKKAKAKEAQHPTAALAFQLTHFEFFYKREGMNINRVKIY